MRVRDEWDEESDPDRDHNLLHVTYDAARITLETLRETIRKEGFEGSVRSP